MAQAEPQSNQVDFGRETIAQRVVFWAGVGIAVISVVALLPAIISTITGAPLKQEVTTQVSSVFNALLPLFGTWMGTVMAYYFSRNNFESAAKATQTLLGLDEKLRQLPVDKYWTPANAIVGITLPAAGAAGATPEAGLSLVDVRNLISKTVTRVPVLTENKAVKYVIHQSLLYRYGFEQGMADTQGKQRTLQDLLAHDDMRQMAETFAVMGPGGTMADAKATMESVPGAQDVFVTAHGGKNDPVLGWITNVDIAKNSKL